jgi:anti-anti-sigma regulatory factor
MAKNTKDIYIKAPRFIDHHITDQRTPEELANSRSTIKEIIKSCIETEKKGNVIVDLGETHHIGKSCIEILANLIKDTSRVIFYRPKEEIYNKLIRHGFPQGNIML